MTVKVEDEKKVKEEKEKGSVYVHRSCPGQGS